MNFELSDEQRLLGESIGRLMADRYAFEARRGFMATETGFSREIWQEYADLGLLALPFAEADGGIGGGTEEVMIVMEALGRALALDPYLSGIVTTAALLTHGASAEQRAALVPEIVDGTVQFAFAHHEIEAGYDLACVGTRAVNDGTGFVLDGAKSLVLHGASAGTFIVSARMSGALRDETGIGLFRVDATAPGLSVRGYPTQDGMRAAEITFSSVKLEADALLGGNRDAFPVIARAVDETIAALCAEAVGAMEQALALTVEYLKTRKQFGRTIGEFQVLQHRASEMVVELEQARSMAMYAAMMARNPDAGLRSRAISAAKAQIGRSGRIIGQSAVQLHGGVGMTMEYAIGHYFKRLTMIDKAYGDVDHHIEKLGLAGGLAA
jgi:pimeloyl-CoA dehydrogenase small subunit